MSEGPDERKAWRAAVERVRAGADADGEARALVARMTVDEKLGCLDGDTDFWPGLVDMVGGGYYRHPWPAAAVPRLGFPGLAFADGPRGIVVGESTCFPVSMARGATFDPALEERVGEALGVEARLQGATFFGGVCVNLLRHPGWGRAQETYGEDPFHVGEMGAALVRGVQRHAMACVKHFACNQIEEARFRVDVRIDDDALHDVYLPHFRRVVDEGVAAVMTAYNAVNGQWCGDSEALVGDVLRCRWGFDGIVVSDFVYGLRDPVASVKAGMDIEMPLRQQRHAALPAALADGTLSIDDVDAAATRVVRTVLRFAASTPDDPGPAALLAGDAHRALAREAAERSVVLLRNEPVDGRPVLPLCAGQLRRVALLGRFARTANLGDGGSSDVHPPSVVTIADGLAEALPGVEWTDDAADADAAIVVVGCGRDDEGEYTGGVSPALLALFPPAPDDDAWSRLAEASRSGRGMALGGDRRRLALGDEDAALVVATAARQPRTVVLTTGGSAITVEGWIDEVPALLHVWYPGMEGGRAIARVLTGDVAPSGRLPFAVPRDEAHLAPFDPDADRADYDAWHGQWLLDRDGRDVRFPFGFGLSYTTFELRGARASGGDCVVDVANTGDVDAATVVFFFRPWGPAKRLVAFRRVEVAAGAVATVRAPFGAETRLVVARHARDPQAVEVSAHRAGDAR